MDEINFINFLQKKNRDQYNLWLKVTMILTFLVILTIIIIQIKQIYGINLLKEKRRNLEQKVINFDDVVKEKNKIKNYKEKLLEQLEKIQKKSSDVNKKFIFNLLTDIANATTEDIYIQKLNYDSKKGVEIKGFAFSSDRPTEFIHNLKRLDFVEKVKLESLKYRENEILDSEDNLFFHEFLITLKLKK